MLARMPKHGGRVIVCVDDIDVADLSKAAAHGTTLDVFVEIDVAPGLRCGVTTRRGGQIAKAIAAAPPPPCPRHPGLPGRDAAHGQLR